MKKIKLKRYKMHKIQNTSLSSHSFMFDREQLQICLITIPLYYHNILAAEKLRTTLQK